MFSMVRIPYFLAMALIGAALAATPAQAQGQIPREANDRQGPACGAGIAHGPSELVSSRILHRAAYRRADVRPGTVRIDFAGHSTFLITSPDGVTVATDFNDFFRANQVADFVTMSGWHYNHTSERIDPGTMHALKGWWSAGYEPPLFDRGLKDVRVYNLPANIPNERRFFRFTTSVFVIESSQLCIAHLGLLGHALSDRDAARLGRIDVLMVPIEQVVTLSFEEIVHNIKLINPRIAVPMHFNAERTVEGFLEDIKSVFPVRRAGGTTFVADRRTLPKQTEVLYIRPPIFTGGFR